MRVVLLGARGQLGAAIVHDFAPYHELFALDRTALDVTDGRAVEVAIGEVRPDVIINCVAFNAVDAAEDRPIQALEVNALAVRTLARAARLHGAALVHYSSDFVFDGETSCAYSEADRPNPRSVYATSKLLGEWFALDAPASYVLRVESLFGDAPGGPPRKGSVAAIIDGLRAGTTPKVFEDRTVSPTYVADAARATRELLERAAAPGVYHCVNSGWCTWAEFAREAAHLMGVEARVQPIRLADARLRAVRPRFCALSNQKLVAAGVSMPTWQDALARYTRSVQPMHVSG
jgi:dTDP-4-dehydrorhamnose reductase